ncbi:heavy-metal-associated domain-containing protein [Brachybacterium paraconglomeratum]|uniref:heavy-metal-associated domain-containing protein n=1 Tax=Brachybacterium paraconglomeratum TaxID=173362 RepID=UPI0021A8AE10|nr:heavy-metal-associated domain-containing protein [Brachybacterium paraconglomeratum]MCT1908915.1 heavy-metal-associated domain-containing protein [Brachybacterium paraconglomeratum]
MSATTGSTTPASTRTVFRAEGFSCPSCVAKIEKQVGRLKGVQDVTVKFASSRVEVEHDPAKATTEQIVDAIAKAGYTAAPSAF